MAPRILHTAAGAIECDIHGSGTPVLVVHGSPGGIDASLVMARFLPPDRFQVICYSRPGYLNTPLCDTDNSFDREADLVVALLDEVGIEQVAVFSWSGGGAPGYRLAVRYPQRVKAIVAFAAVSSKYVLPSDSPHEGWLLSSRTGEKVLKFLARHAPERLVKSVLEGEGNLQKEELRSLVKSVMADPNQWLVIVDVAITATTTAPRRPGWENDMANYNAVESLELEKISCPVLLIHGDADTDAVPEYSKIAQAALPNCKLIWMNRGTHLAFYAHQDASKMQEVAIEWLLSPPVDEHKM